MPATSPLAQAGVQNFRRNGYVPAFFLAGSYSLSNFVFGGRKTARRPYVDSELTKARKESEVHWHKQTGREVMS